MSRRRSAELAFASVRAEFELPGEFSPAAIEEARHSPDRFAADREDRRDLALVTIDPQGSRDLDQAVELVRTPDGMTLHYAIADVGALVVPGGALDAASRERGETYYLPDASIPLHPRELSEGRASLLPEEDRPAVLWSIELDARGAVREVAVRRALVRSRAQLDYDAVQADADAGREPHPSIAALADFGALRRAQAEERGAIELDLPDQQVVARGGNYVLELDPRTAAASDNAQLSLLTGMCAADIMLAGRVGLLRTLPPGSAEAGHTLRDTARALGIDVPDGYPLPLLLAELPADPAIRYAVMSQATALLRGAGYAAFDGELPALTGHAGVAAPYAHVTAPLRRLSDRFSTEVVLALSAGTEIPRWARTSLPEAARIMASADSRASAVDRACVDRIEAAVLSTRIGERLDAIVLRAGTGERGAELFLPEPVVIARTPTDAPAGSRVTVEVTAADPDAPSLALRVLEAGPGTDRTTPAAAAQAHAAGSA